MEKRTVFAVVALVVLGLGAWLALRAPEKGQRSGPASRPIAAFKGADVAHLELTNEKQEKTVLDKKGDAWRLTAPSDQPADQSAVKTLLDGLEKLGFGDVVTESDAKHEELGVKEGKAQHLVVKNGTGATLLDALVGKSVGGFTMLRPVGKSDVWQANGLFPYMINREPKGWRDHAVFDGNAKVDDVEKLTVEEGANKVTFEKTGDKWKVASAAGDAPKADAGPDDLDQGMITGAAQALVVLRASDFADGKKPAEVGLDKPSFTITAAMKGGATKTLVVGPLGEDVHMKRGDADQIYTIKKFGLERLTRRPADFRDKTLVKAKEADLAAVEITQGADVTSLEKSADNKWKVKGAKEVDDNKVKSVVSAFENLAGAAFSVEKDPAKTGLAKPTATVLVRTTDKKVTTLKVGAVKDGADYYVQRAGTPDVLMVKKFVLERILKKPADLAPSKTPAAAAPAPGHPGMAAPAVKSAGAATKKK